MATKAAHKRLTKEYVTMQKEPPPFVWAIPDEKNILTWNFIVRGPPDSPFAGGEYHGALIFPSEYPFKPPGIKMYTPSGRFQPDKKICFSMSDFHPGTWNPAWSVATILTGLLSFMLSDELTTGSMTTSDADKRAFALRSHGWNIQQRRFKEVFPEYCTDTLKGLPNMGERDQGRPSLSVDVQITSSSPQSPVSAVTSTPYTALATPASASSLRPRMGVPPVSAGPGAGPEGAKGTNNGPGLGPGSGSGVGWATAWRQLLWEKWRWGVLIALAVIVSRLSSSA